MDFCLIRVNRKWVMITNLFKDRQDPSIALSSAQVKLNLIGFRTLTQRFVLPQLAEAFVFPETLRASHLAGQRALGKEYFFVASKLRMRRQVSNRTVEPDRVVNGLTQKAGTVPWYFLNAATSGLSLRLCVQTTLSSSIRLIHTGSDVPPSGLKPNSRIFCKIH
jgi:hypothetical protein